MLILAIILIVLGVLLRVLAIRSMRGMFSGIIRVQPVVTTGIYGWMRHPSYVGGFIILTGLTLISCELGVLYLGLNFMAARAIQEESILGPMYNQYKKKVGILFPLWWRK
jgi:protein-S-isoprenylcysteine O-methyltransferase